MTHINRGKVIIVGAGMAGISAANRLRMQGWQVVLLEASNRVGGRIRTDREWGFPIELGANWIHNAFHRGNPLKEKADQLGIQYQKTNYNSARLYRQNGSSVSDIGLALRYTKLEKHLIRYAQTHSEYNSVEDVIHDAFKEKSLSQKDRLILDSVISEGFRTALGEDLDKADGPYYVKFKTDSPNEKDYLVLNGFDHLPKQESQKLPIRLNCRVSEIDDTGKKVTVQTDQGPYEGDYVIVTTSLGVLKSGAIRFTKRLSDAKEEAITSLGMANFNKVFFRFANRFWSDNKHYHIFQTEMQSEFGIFLNYHRYSGHPIWVAETSGESSRQLLSDTESKIREKWLNVFHRAFPNKEVDIEEIKCTHWEGDQYAKGAFCYVPVGASEKSFEAMSLPEGRVRFAGEATIAKHHGYVHGAMLSGIREADRIIYR